MTNEQLAGARRAMNRYPEVSFRIVPTGVRVRETTVTVTPEMKAEDVFKACIEVAATNA